MSGKPTSAVLMDTGTLEALKGSIAKWGKVASGSQRSRGSDDCALCHRFYPENVTGFDWDGDVPPNRCQGCPVNAHTKNRGCGGTPCADYATALLKGDRVGALRYAAQELEFLIGLLPSGEREEP